MKIIWVLAVVLLSEQTFASTEMILKVSNRQHFSMTETVEVRSAKELYYGGILVPKAALPSLQKALVTLSTLPATPSAPCASGVFEYRIKTSAKIQFAKGCSEGREFADKYMAFLQFKKQVASE